LFEGGLQGTLVQNRIYGPFVSGTIGQKMEDFIIEEKKIKIRRKHVLENR